MENKKCKTCGEIKRLEEFPFHNKKEKTYRADCLLCYNKKRRERRSSSEELQKKSRERSKKYYYNNREASIERAKAYLEKNKDKHKIWAKKSKEKRRNRFIEYKSTLSCEICGEDHIACIDFHHIDPSEKERNINKLWACPNILKEELKKCIPLCANCHRKLHWEERNNNINN